MGKNKFQMENENKSQNETEQELEAENQHLAEIKEDEVRENIISEYGFDPDADKERIDKLVQKEVGYRKTLSTTIGQKIKYRNELQTAKQSSNQQQSKATDVDIDQKLTAALEKRDLEALEYSDEIKDAIQKVATNTGVSVRKAISDPYIQFKIDAWKKEHETDEAALSRNNKKGSKTANDIDNPPDVDFSTEEGRKEYDKWKADMIKKGH